MKILPLHLELEKYLAKRGLAKKFQKQAKLFKQDLFHKSLNTELLEPKYLRFWSFRVDKKFRAIFIFRNKEEVEIIDINNHYK